MRLSEAMVLGSTVCKPTPGAMVIADGARACGLGMAAIAAGGTIGPAEGVQTRTKNIEQFWPWTEIIMRRPCDCWFGRRNRAAKDIIAHLFDRHVFGKADWTMEQLQQWVESVEPKTIDLTASATITWPFMATPEQAESMRVQREAVDGLR